ncbi:MAG: phosphoribosylanthranilate isomerase [Gammaproteobacteria bacterium]
MTRIKICGITREADAQAAADAGADAIGLVFHPASPRCVSLAMAASIVRIVGPFVTTVGLFVDAAPERVREVLADTGVHLLQLHGSETPDYCAQFGVPYIKALRMAPGLDAAAASASYPAAAGLLFDAWDPLVAGGTGAGFDWSRLPALGQRPLILAGGLAPANVAAAVRQVRPYAVDVSSGVETAPGIKDSRLMRDFIVAAKAASR